MAFSDFLDPVFQPMLTAVGPSWTVVILAIVISLLITIIYKYATNQKLMKELKEGMKQDQARMKELKDKPQKMMEVQKQVMEKNMKYMMQSMRATLITFIPIIIIFSWMSGHLAFEPVRPNTEFMVSAIMKDGTTGEVSMRFGDAKTGQESANIVAVGPTTMPIDGNRADFKLKAGSGEYFLEFEHEGSVATRYVTVTNQPRYSPPSMPQKDSAFADLQVSHEKLIVLNLFGWKLGWLGTYIILSIGASMGLRKLLKVY